MPDSGSESRLAAWEKVGAVAVVSLRNPPVNVLTEALLRELKRCLTESAQDTSVRAVVLRSALENVFSAGADIRQMATLSPSGARRYAGIGQSVTRAIEQMPLPVVAAVHGTCVGGGCEIAQACDAIVASSDARFGQPEIRLGIVPGWGGTQRLPTRIGLPQARRWIFGGATYSAEEARTVGLVDQVVPRADLANSALALANDWGSRSSGAFAAAKRALQWAADPTLFARLNREARLWASLFGTPDQMEGMRAFLEKRPFTPAARSLPRRRSSPARRTQK